MKIGMYSDDEILEHLTEGEGRGFLGRSMYDAIKETLENKDKEIKNLNNIINEVRKKINNLGTYELMGKKYISKDEVLNISELKGR